jgi:GlpG protein
LLSDFSKNTEVSRWLVLSTTGMRLAELRQGQLWRLWTPMLLHATVMHLLFNMYWLYGLGSAIEIRRGTRVLAAVVLVTGLGGTLGQLFIGQPLFVGFSGGVYGLLGYVWMKSRFDPGAGLFVDSGTVMLMVAWLFLCFSGVVGPVANGAHLGGLITGVALGFPFSRLLR